MRFRDYYVSSVLKRNSIAIFRFCRERDWDRLNLVIQKAKNSIAVFGNFKKY